MAKKTESETVPDAPSALVTVRVTGQPVAEGDHYQKGETFETTPERAAALGDLVEIVTAD